MQWIHSCVPVSFQLCTRDIINNNLAAISLRLRNFPAIKKLNSFRIFRSCCLASSSLWELPWHPKLTANKIKTLIHPLSSPLRSLLEMWPPHRCSFGPVHLQGQLQSPFPLAQPVPLKSAMIYHSSFPPWRQFCPILIIALFLLWPFPHYYFSQPIKRQVSISAWQIPSNLAGRLG